MRFIPAKTIVTRTTGGDDWFGHDYNMNIYKGCCHGCIYCDSRSECYHVDNFDEVRAKENSLNIIERELKGKRKKGIIGTGAMSDPYNPFEKEYELTREALKLISKYGYGISTVTKSSLITRDIDLYERIKEYSPVSPKLTITTFDDELCKKLEPNVTVSSQRFKAVQQLAEAGIYTGILMTPILPFINDMEKNISNIVYSALDSGAKFIYASMGVTLRQNQRDYFYSKLDDLFPDMKQRYIRTFGDSYNCISPQANKLWERFTSLCEKYKIIYKMPQIIHGYKNIKTETQLSLF